MASKTKINGLNHTAGIYSDMTVDGPEIGTLVVIVDRAKNLPNRKTIGKQDPYCAARLGKEAKKTETDRRGGQTPRWDQELRFTVHDSPDYYQLKVSVFNDDKKTDLIGETWVNLQEVVVAGGGQNDIWHSLNCKGKYAGEIRIEITYYDSRPKQEKPERAKQSATNGIEEGRDSLKGPRQQQKAPVKRRPLPSDPVTGAPPPQTDNSPPHSYQIPVGGPDHNQTPPRGHQPPSAIPEHVHTPTRGYQSPNYIPNQSPLQSVEYHTPPPRAPQNQNYAASPRTNGYASSPDMYGASPHPRDIPHERQERYDHNPRNFYQQEPEYHEEDDPYNDRDHYGQYSPYELPHPEEFGSPPSPDGPPPPPPVHRSRHNSHQASPSLALKSQGSYSFHPDNGSANSYESPAPDMHHHSMPPQAQAQPYQPYTPPAKDDQFRRSANETVYEQPPPRSNSYDSRYNGNYGSMQPTVEDEPPTPNEYRGSGSRTSQYDDRRYDQVPSPAPLNISGRGSSASGRYSASIAPSTAPSTQYSNGYGSVNSPVSFTHQTVSSQSSYNTLPRQAQLPRKYSDDGDRMVEYGTPDAYGLPPVPPTLVAGMDPSIAQEISERIYAEKRASSSQSGGNTPRKHDSQPNRPHPLSYYEAAQPFVPTASTYDERQTRVSTATVAAVKPRALSPSPARKSVSPQPETPDTRRLSGVPFGPDSYNVLNQVAGSAPSPSLSARYDTKDDPDAKIITHDGREVDPSDHIPESNYAPLLEPKGPKYASQQPDRNYRAPLSASQQNPATGRTQLRQAPRTQHMANSSPVFTSGNTPEHSVPQAGRNRLQKKANRMSAQPAPHSSPLGPVSSYQDNSYSPSPGNLPRANTGDYQNENYAPSSYGGSPSYRGTSGAPPIPAKIPMGPHAPPPQPNSQDAWALLEEMKNIDLGSGRARRKQH
ncbi:hypothetical protein B0O99DRAFT_666859 [Bisporella sp. PMI_857]|nr:hypothetical protein B0O99DRAFT_666859 [Bisporella sp. PMI_857]